MPQVVLVQQVHKQDWQRLPKMQPQQVQLMPAYQQLKPLQAPAVPLVVLVQQALKRVLLLQQKIMRPLVQQVPVSQPVLPLPVL